MADASSTQKKAEANKGRTSDYCCPHSAVMTTPITVTRIDYYEDESGLHVTLVRKRAER